ncbi:N-acyl-D-amino-acid deacylase family protein [Raineyella sp. LH-20]|uniref:N-acyl-D-amino-acid deacylase family protein n=1 Tax=Raineyella sp. LH-20 TaxID=3081204 RepID=UPI00295583B2|nr:amidohydrolase family protein [Raineyella sp. LH-20]WOP19614.1 amidohydrolase family protein [Raineyella sp. LH-20]
MEAEIVIRAADVVEATGVRRADVALEGGLIAAVGTELPIDSAAEVIDGRGLLLVPGFIDLHAHSALHAFDEPQMSAKVGQGFTTELVSLDGLGPAPLSDAVREDRRRYLAALEPSAAAPWDWTSLADYLEALRAAGPTTSMVTCVPHSAVREVVMGGADRRPTDVELREMQDLVAVCCEAGARAVSFGMIYAPGLFADTAELTAIAEVAARYGVPLVPHVRNEASGVLDSIREFVQVAERTGAPLHISHLKLIGSADLFGDLMALLAEAATRISLTVDQYPYGAGSTILAALLPPYAFAGGPAALLDRLSSRTERTRMAYDMMHGLPGWENLFGACGPEHIVITQAAAPRTDEVGLTVAAIAERTGDDPAGAVLRLLADTALDVGMIDHYASEQMVRDIYRESGSLVGTDGVFNPHPHPRLHGTAPKLLGRFALEERLVDVPEAVRRMSTEPARVLGLRDRGIIAPGYRADLALLDPASFRDSASYQDPIRLPDGVRRVIVDGHVVWREGRHTGLRPGSVIRTAPVGA